MILLTITNKNNQPVTFYVDKIDPTTASAYSTVPPSFMGHMTLGRNKTVTVEESRLNLGQIVNLQKVGTVAASRRSTNEDITPSLSPSPSFGSPSPSLLSPSPSRFSPSISVYSPSVSALSPSISISAFSPSPSFGSPSISVLSPSISISVGSPSGSPSPSLAPSSP